MSLKSCPNGHTFEKTSDCPVCPICSARDMEEIFGKDFPNIGNPAKRALYHLKVTSIEDLQQHSEKELLALHGFGPRALQILKDELGKDGLEFKE